MLASRLTFAQQEFLAILNFGTAEKTRPHRAKHLLSMGDVTSISALLRFQPHISLTLCSRKRMKMLFCVIVTMHGHDSSKQSILA